VNTHYNYMPTYTGPGHASIYTGTTPAVHGIVGNNWWSKINNAPMYCADDSTVQTVGAADKNGKMSPRNLLTTTITDEVKLFSNFQSKVIGIALKDRGAILPAGHSADAAYWYDTKNGKWISSTYYMKELPQWVNDFNAQRWTEFYNTDWNTLLPIEQYTESTLDNADWEGTFKSEKQPTFPHSMTKIIAADSSLKYSLIASTPFGNTLTRQFAESVLDNEKLGTGSATDFLAISFSSTDYAGHKYGPNSIEVEDVYLRLDKDLEILLNDLDKKIGRENVLVFLTADHGAAHSPNFSVAHKLPGGISDSKKIKDSLQLQMKNWYGEGSWIVGLENQQIYLNRKLMIQKNINADEAIAKCVNYLKQNFAVIQQVFAASMLQNQNLKTPFFKEMQNGFFEKRCGDIYITLESGWLEDMSKGTSHGTSYAYDTHVPLLFWGNNLKAIEINSAVEITDIAPTIANQLHIQEPSGCTGKVIELK
jgi:predicted AlkP superfamily pyrophosphatase or phosphodiesterase